MSSEGRYLSAQREITPEPERDPFGRSLVGGWILTYGGRRVWPLEMVPEDVDLEDIAHALSMKCRYNGHCRKFYSVAQHSRVVSYHVPDHLAAHALLHDAGEYVLPDIARPIKSAIAGFERVESRALEAIGRRFGLDPELFDDPAVKLADNRILGDEMQQLMIWQKDIDFDPIKRFGSLGVTIVPDSPEQAKRAFLKRAEELELK